MVDYSKLIYDDLKRIIKDVREAANPADTVGGTVVTTDPVQVQLELQSDPVPSGLVTVPEAYSIRVYEDVEFEISEGQAPIVGGEGGYVDFAGVTLKGKLTFDNRLQEGDKVLMVRGQDGQRFVVTGKVEEEVTDITEEGGGENAS